MFALPLLFPGHGHAGKSVLVKNNTDENIYYYISIKVWPCNNGQIAPGKDFSYNPEGICSNAPVIVQAMVGQDKCETGYISYQKLTVSIEKDQNNKAICKVIERVPLNKK